MLHISSPAKINLFLEVTGKRPDGFHNIESVFLEIPPADRLAVEPAAGGISLACDYPGLETGTGNLVIRAAETLRKHAGVNSGARFRLEKRIPPGSGLGGGSSNAAAALRLANLLWKTGLSDMELAAVGAEVGSDVPFFLHGGTCLCGGRGEVVEPLPPFPKKVALGLALSGIHSSTAAAYRELVLPRPKEQRRAGSFIAAMTGGDEKAMADLAFNRFEPVVFSEFPPLADIHGRLSSAGMTARLSGTGSAIWFFGPAEKAQNALAGIESVKVMEITAGNRYGGVTKQLAESTDAENFPSRQTFDRATDCPP